MGMKMKWNEEAQVWRSTNTTEMRSEYIIRPNFFRIFFPFLFFVKNSKMLEENTAIQNNLSFFLNMLSIDEGRPVRTSMMLRG